MIEIDSYMNDGACWQAQMVLAFLRSHQDVWREKTWNNKAKAYDVKLEVGRFENCREQGYVFTILIPFYCQKNKESVQRNWAVYEHRNSDEICVLISDAFTINTPSVEQMFNGRNKWDVDKRFSHRETYDCGEFVAKSIWEFVTANYVDVEERGE